MSDSQHSKPSIPHHFTVYCSGSIAKSSDTEDKLCWGDAEKQAVQQGAKRLPIYFLDPAEPLGELSDTTALFGRDMLQVRLADAVVVDARQRRGIGIGIEMLAAHLLDAHLVAVVPPDSHYRRKGLEFRGGHVRDYVHPHLASLCDAVVDSFEEAGRWLAERARHAPQQTDREVIESAISAYRERLLASDSSMRALLSELLDLEEAIPPPSSKASPSN